MKNIQFVNGTYAELISRDLSHGRRILIRKKVYKAANLNVYKKYFFLENILIKIALSILFAGTVFKMTTTVTTLENNNNNNLCNFPSWRLIISNVFASKSACSKADL